MFDPSHLDNHRQIFAILSQLYAAGGIKYRSNPRLSRAVIEGAKLMLFKRFYLTWSYAIPKIALQNELSFGAFRNCIFLASPKAHSVQRYWDGGGNYLDDGWRACLEPNLAFTVMVTDYAFSLLKPYLEDPANRATAESGEIEKLMKPLSLSRMPVEGISRDMPTVPVEGTASSLVDNFIRSVYGDPPPTKRANNDAAISLAFRELLMQDIERQDVCEAIWELAWTPIPYTTHELALSGALSIFKHPDNVPRLMHVQMYARVTAISWLKEGLVAPIFVRSFEDTLYEIYEPSKKPNLSWTIVDGR